MSQATHPRVVGAFVLGAIALVLAAIVLLSAGNWFEPRSRFTVYFPGSVRGLDQGAPVTFRGVRIGEVKDVTAFLTGPDNSLIQIEVLFEVRTQVVEAPEGITRRFADDDAGMAQALIERGVRARLLSQSMLTGQKYIDLDFLPDAPARFAGMQRGYPELPTTPTAMEALGERAESFFEKLAALPLDTMLVDTREALQALREVLTSPELKAAVAGTRRTTAALEPTIHEARLAIADARGLIQNLDTRLNGLAADSLVGEMRSFFGQVRFTLDSLNRTLANADETRLQATQAFLELDRAMKSLRNLAEYFQTHPEAVLAGKPRDKR